VQFPLAPHVGDGDLNYPAAVVEKLIVREIGGQPHPKSWDGLVDTGAALTSFQVYGALVTTFLAAL
jgi:hypothetical protein